LLYVYRVLLTGIHLISPYRAEWQIIGLISWGFIPSCHVAGLSALGEERGATPNKGLPRCRHKTRI
jgi:hypothetical protein